MAGPETRASRFRNKTSEHGRRDPTMQHSVEGTAPSDDIHRASREASHTAMLKQQTVTEERSQEFSSAGESGNILCQNAFVNALT